MGYDFLYMRLSFSWCLKLAARLCDRFESSVDGVRPWNLRRAFQSVRFAESSENSMMRSLPEIFASVPIMIEANVGLEFTLWVHAALDRVE
jgi:hypothetical protein